MNKLFWFILFLVFTSVSFAQKVRVSITFTFTEQYCGGARPTEEMELAAVTPKPYANKTIVIVCKNGRVDSAKTNSAGVLKLKLRRGSYTLYEAWRHYLYTPEDLPITSFDKACLIEEWKKSIVTLTILRKETKVKFNYDLEKVCAYNSPCLLSTEVPPGRE